MTQTAIK